MTEPSQQGPHSAQPSNLPLIAPAVALLVASTASLLYWHSSRRAHVLTSHGPLSSEENSDNTLNANSDKDKMAVAVHSLDNNLVPGVEPKATKTRSKDRRRRGKDPLKEIMKNTKHGKTLLQNLKTIPVAESGLPTSQDEVRRASSSRSRRSSITESTRSSSSSVPTWEEEKTSESSVSQSTAPPPEIEAFGDADTTLTPHALSGPTIPPPLGSSTNELQQSQQIIADTGSYETSSSTPPSTTTTTTNAGSTTSAVTSDFPQSSESQSASDSTPLDRIPSPTRQDTVRPITTNPSASSSSNGSDPWAWDGQSEPRQTRVGSKSRNSRASSSTRSPAASSVMGYSRPAAPPRPSSSLAKDSPASVPSANVMDTGLGASSVVYNTVGPRLSITPSPTPPPGGSNFSMQTQLASLRGALEAARVREEKSRQEAERLACECEALNARWWEDVSTFRRKEMEYQNQIQYLMHSLHAYASFAASQPASPSGHLSMHNPISVAFTSPGTNSPSSNASQAQLATTGTQPPPSIPPQSQPQSPALSGAAAATSYYPQAVYQTGPPLPPAPGPSQAPVSTNGGIHMPLSMPPAPQMTAGGGGAGPWAMPMPISSPTMLVPNGAVPGHVSEQQRRGRRQSRSNSAHSHESVTAGGGNGNGISGFDGFTSVPGTVSASAGLPPPMESSWVQVPHPHAHVQGMLVPSQSMPLPQLHSLYNNDYQEDPVRSNDVNDVLADAILRQPQSLRAASSNVDLGDLRKEEEGREEQEAGVGNEVVVGEGEKKKSGKRKKERPHVFTFPSLSNIGNVVKEQEWSSEEEDEDDSEGRNDEAVVIGRPPFSDAGDVTSDSSGSAGQPPSASPSKNSSVAHGSEILTSDMSMLMRRTSDAEDTHGRSATEPVR